MEELLAQQVAIVERTLIPLVRTATKKLDDSRALETKLEQLMEVLRGIDARIREGKPIKPLGKAPGGETGPTDW